MKIKIDAEQFENALVVVLRTPGLFMLDQWWQHYRDEVRFKSGDVKTLMPSMVSILMACGGFLLATLRLEALVAVYMHLLSGALLVVADLFSRYYVYAEQERLGGEIVTSPVRHAAALISHLVFATIISFLLEIRDDRKRCLLVLYCLPVVARIAGFPVDSLLVAHNFISAFIVLVTIYYVITVVIPACVDWARDRWDEAAGTGHLESGVFVWETSPILGFDGLLASQFLLLWGYLFVSNLYLGSYDPRPSLSWYLTLLGSAAVGCGSPVSVAATGVAIARLSRLILFLAKAYLAGGFREVRGQTIGIYQESVLQSGWTEGFTFALLAFQANLSEIGMPEKAALMSIILFIVLSSLVQSLFEATEPVVMSLGASEVRLNSSSICKHLRAVVLCLGLFIFPLYMTYILNQILDLDFWSLVVISTCLVTSVQVLGLLVIYCLFLYDLTREEAWEKLDDVVYVARALTRVLEFFIALFVVGIGVKESVLGDEQWSAINCSIVFVHCYFNVWQRLQSGWDSFLRRRTASKKVSALPLVGDAEGHRFNDACPICFGEMQDDGRILPCRHVFHRACLQKWFYVQEKCPMCQKPVFLEGEVNRAVSESAN